MIQYLYNKSLMSQPIQFPLLGLDLLYSRREFDLLCHAGQTCWSFLLLQRCLQYIISLSHLLQHPWAREGGPRGELLTPPSPRRI